MGIEWAGWRTDTFSLQQAGWQIAVEHDSCRYAYTLLLHHAHLRLYAVTAQEVVGNYTEVVDPYNGGKSLPVWRVTHVAPRIETMRVAADLSQFRQVDARPQIVTHDIQSIEDFNIFATCLTRTEEILFDRADMTVVEHLEAIKALQSNKQREIRERIRKKGACPPGTAIDAAPKQEVVAQLIHLAA